MKKIVVAVVLVLVAVVMWFAAPRLGKALPTGDAAGVPLQKSAPQQPAQAPAGNEPQWGR